MILANKKRSKNIYLLKGPLIFFLLLFLVLQIFLKTHPTYAFEDGQSNFRSSISKQKFLVKFKKQIDLSKREQLRKELNCRILKIFGRDKNFAVLEIKKISSDLRKILREKVGKISGCEGIEEVKIRKLAYLPNDPFRDFQWYLSNVNAYDSWDIEDGKRLSPIVAIIDSGADLSHEELRDKLWVNTDEVPGNLFDDDKNGYIDDIHGVNIIGVSQLKEGFRSEEKIEYERKVAQTVLGNHEYVTGISIKIRKESGTNGLYIMIYEGMPGSTLKLLRRAFVAASSIPLNYKEVFVKLSSPVRFELNKHYTILLETESTDDRYFVKDYGGDNFFRGEEWVYSLIDFGGWVKFKDYDLWFKLDGFFEPYDDDGHGTSVSGVVAAKTNNNYLIAGSAPEARIMIIKASNGEYLESSDIIEAIYYAVDNGAHIINMSFAGPSDSSFEQNAINYAAEKGCLLVAAAGNDNTDIRYYPAAYENVLGVSAYNKNQIITGFSNYGDYIDISLPGEGILSIVPYSSSLIYLDGTSFSAPIASALGALVMSLQSEIIGKTAGSLMKRFAIDIGNPGWDPFYGYGKADFYNLLSKVATPTIERFAGSDRHETSVFISKKFFSTATAVVIARSDLFPDSLTASVLAVSLNSPLLITPKEGLNEIVKQEIERLSPEFIYLIGGEGALSSEVEEQVKTLSSVKSVIRISGRDRYETGTKVADQVVKITGHVKKIVVATGENFPDALSAAPLAGYLGSPIILVKKDQLPPSVLEFLSKHRPEEALIVGGTGVVSASVEASLSRDFGISVNRIGGNNRYETSAKLYDYALNEAKILSKESVFLATGQDFPDALSAGVPAGLKGFPLLIIKPSYYLDYSTISSAVSSIQLQTIYVAGGTGALPRAAVSRFFEALKCAE